jgi:hypothetical protein
MNERIQELLNQAGIYQPDRFDAIDGSNQMEKFAELIVRECADLFDKNETEYAIPEHRIHNSIMIHFGLY